ncbi:MAG: hypothetical protein R2788_14785 [Saprospiraceae bacterium]
MGESGVYAALLAQHLGYEVFVSDTGSYQGQLQENLQISTPNEESKHIRTNICQI